jgi:hypothetical protein
MYHLKGLILILLGSIYLLKPYIYGKGLWFKTSFAPRNLAANDFRKYIQSIAIVLIAIGIVFLVFDNIGH